MRAFMPFSLVRTRRRARMGPTATLLGFIIALGSTRPLPAHDLGLAGGADPVPFGTPTAEIYVDGELGGQIEWNNTGVAVPFPEGACGFRVDGVNLLSWTWYEGGIWGTDVMAIPHNNQAIPEEPGEWIEFTGSVGASCDGAPWVFHTPATPGGDPPANAVKLVIQFLDWNDIEFLDGNFQVIPAEDPWGPDPEPVDPCEIPEFCEPPVADTGGLAVCIPQWDLGWTCDPDEEEAEQGARFSFAAAWKVQAAVAALGVRAPSVGDGVGRAVDAANAWLGAAASSQGRLWQSVGKRKPVPAEGRLLGRYATALDQGRGRLDECRRAVADAAAGLGAETRARSQRAATTCKAAAAQLFDAHEAAQALAHLRSFEASAKPPHR